MRTTQPVQLLSHTPSSATWAATLQDFDGDMGPSPLGLCHAVSSEATRMRLGIRMLM